MISEKLPAVVGSNIAGTIEQVGSSVTGFRRGDKVFGLSDILSPGNDQGGLQEYAILSATAATATPPTFTADQVVTLPTNLSTSFHTLFNPSYGFGWPAPWEDKAGFDAAGHTLVIIAAGTTVGKFAVQLAKMTGIGKIITIAGAGNKDELERMGATHTIDRHGSVEQITKQVHAITGVDGVKHVHDCHNMSFELAASLLSANQDTELVALLPEERPGELVAKRPRVNAKFTESPSLGQHKAAFWKHAPIWLEEGKVLPGAYRVVEGLHKVDEINEALDGYMAGKGGPQLIVRP